MAGMEPVFQMTDVAAKALTRLKGYKFMKDFFEFYSEDNRRGQFINWSKEKYAADIENMRLEMYNAHHGMEPRMQVALAHKISTLIEDGILRYSTESIKEIVAGHNQQVAEQKKQSNETPTADKEDNSAVDRKNLTRMLKGEGGIENEARLQYMEPSLLPKYIEFLEFITVQFKTESEKYLRIHEENKIFFTSKNKPGKQSNNEHSENCLLPEILRDPADITIIDNWLLKRRLIKVFGKDKAKPYKWARLNENRELEIYSKVNDASSNVSEEKKARRFSWPTQIAALGYWLEQMNKLNIETYEAPLVGGAVLRYYNMEDTVSNRKIFQEGNDNLRQYYKYFDRKDELESLEDALNRSPKVPPVA